MKNSEYFTKDLDYINNPTLKEIVALTLDNAPECIVHIPASSSGKYHPSYSLGEGGLMRHIKAAVGIAHSLIATEIFKNFIFGSDEKVDSEMIDLYADCAYAALILHDCMKPDVESENKSTRFDHPLLGAKLFTDTANDFISHYCISVKDKEVLQTSVPLIKSAIESHMGQWTESNYMPDVVLPKPKTTLQQFVHLMDYLDSRKFLIFDFDVYNDVNR